MGRRKANPEVMLSDGPHIGKMVDGDEIGWYVNAVADPFDDGQKYRRRPHNQATHEPGLSKSLDVTDGTDLTLGAGTDE